MSDLISRQAAIEWCRPEDWGTPDERWRPESEYGAMLEALPSAEPEIIRCRECKHYHENVWGGQLGYPKLPLILGHEMCDFWGDGCKTKEDGYCFAAERRTDAAD